MRCATEFECALVVSLARKTEVGPQADCKFRVDPGHKTGVAPLVDHISEVDPGRKTEAVHKPEADPSHKIEVGPNFDHRFVVVGHTRKVGVGPQVDLELEADPGRRTTIATLDCTYLLDF